VARSVRKPKLRHAKKQYPTDHAEAALDRAASAARHNMKTRRASKEEEVNV
jgi:hypothetical protein